MASNGKGRRVAVTGIGAVTCIGLNVDSLWSAVKAGSHGIGPVRGFTATDELYIRIAGEILNFDPKALGLSKTLLLADKYSQYAGLAAAEAIKQSGLETPFKNGERTAAIVGSGAGGLVTLERAFEDILVYKKKALHPLTLLRTIISSAAAHISIDYGVKGPVFGTVSACATAAHAIGLAFQMVRSGAVDVAITGASEAAINMSSMRAWQAMRVLSPEGCFPFSKRRNGTVLGDGGGILVLEDMEQAKARGATILAEVLGFGMTSDAGDMVNPNIEGPSRAMRLALDDAGLQPGDIDYLNAHGTATAANDINETRAIKAVFGEHANRLPVSSTKSMHGHCLGGAGAVEAAVCIKAMREGYIPPTIGFDEPGDECDLDYVPNEGRRRDLRFVMSNSFAFGGLNAVLVFGQPRN
jgi:nodulation protein E